MIKDEYITHIPNSEYCYGIDINTIVFRIKVKKNNLKKVILWYGHTGCRTTPIEYFQTLMSKKYSDRYFDYFEVELKLEINRVCYAFQLFNEEEVKFYYGNSLHKVMVDDRSEYYKLPCNRIEDICIVPNWLKDAIVYNVFPDSFATAHKYISGESKSIIKDGHESKGLLGGTIKGITENLDYISSMGFNTVYINPIFTAGEYHKYDLFDYYSIDPVFGTNNDFKELVDCCHNKNMKIIIDGVFNHCGWNFFAFQDVVKHGHESKYYKWFYKVEIPVIIPNDPNDYPNYECFGFERMMPKINTSNEEVCKYFYDVARYWTEEYKVDGWRLDVADEVNRDFWRGFRNTVKKFNSEAVIIGEVWQNANYWLTGDMFDSAMNYDFRKHVKHFIAEKNINKEEFNDKIIELLTRYRIQYVESQLNLLDSHDVPRFLSSCNNNVDKYLQALCIQMSFSGAPSVFYGDEQGLIGVKESDYRQKMVFNDNHIIKWHLEKFIKLRKKYCAFKSLDYKMLNSVNELFMYNKDNIQFIFNISDIKVNVEKSLMHKTVLLENGLENGILKEDGFIILI